MFSEDHERPLIKLIESLLQRPFRNIRKTDLKQVAARRQTGALPEETDDGDRLEQTEMKRVCLLYTS
ncbi:MAG: hypothetical protein MPK62_07485, partial [Alphaproteobacteria bacterium]|nr:hypothetical protein [Alphaproteobacteria bacterium]